MATQRVVIPRPPESEAATESVVAPPIAFADPSAVPTVRDRLAARAAVGPRFDSGTVIDHYEVIRALGRGGMGAVYLARDKRLGRRVALKFLLRVSREHSKRFQREARATAQLTHENIVALYDVAEHASLPYLVLEYVPGKTLSAWFRERLEAGQPPRMSPERAAELMLPVARALQCAHDAGIVHRDIKPGNIMLAESGTVKVLDFGVAKDVGAASRAEPRAAGSRDDPAHTRNDDVVGTHSYMAPEQWGAEPVDGRTDVWGVGIMLFQMVTGEHPLGALSPQRFAWVALSDEPMPSVRERMPEVGRLGVVIDRCLVKSKHDRLGSARELCQELEAIARPRAVVAGSDGEDANPYAGLAAFQERDAARFFGRETLVEQVVSRLGDQPLLALVGSSGAGKSSLVRAGVIPALKRGDAWEAFVVRPGARPLAVLAELLLQHSWHSASSSTDSSARGDPLVPISDRETMCDRLAREPGFFGAQLRARAVRRRERVLLFVDQFEEVYTLAPEADRDALFACLAGAADDASSPLRVMISIRHDYLDRMASSATALPELVSRGTVLVGPLGRRGLRSALVAPAEAQSHHFESEALVDEMLDGLASAASPLPLLQFTAAKLWEGRDRDRRVLAQASYRAFGGVGGALAGHADAVIGALSSAERRCARTLLLRLVTPERTRAIVTRSEISELGNAAELERVLDRLIEARLVTLEGTADESTVELVHESLIDAWPALTRWLDDAQDDAQFRARLRSAAKEWEASNFAEGLLWRSEAAEEATRRNQQDPDRQLSAREARYLAAVIALDARDRRRRRLSVWAVIAVLSIVVIVVSALAIRSNRAARRADAQASRADAEKAEAEVQRAEAERSAASARNATRIAVAHERQDDPTTVLALLRELEPGAIPHGWGELARWALDAGVASSVLRGHDDVVEGVAFSPDGQHVATASWDKTVRVWSSDGSGEPLVLRGHEGPVGSVAYSPDGQHVASVSNDKTLRVWRADGTGTPLVLRGHDGPVASVAYSPTGQRIATASWDKTVRVWNADGTGQPLVLRGHTDPVLSVAFSPDGRRIASAAYDKTVRIWTVDGSAPPIVLRGHEAGVYTVAFSPDGQYVATGSGDNTVRLWKADGSGTPVVLRGHDDRIYTVRFAPDGRIISGGNDKTVRVWSADGSRQLLVLGGHDAAVEGVSVTRDGRRIASVSSDRTVRVWDISRAGLSIQLRGHEGTVLGVAFSPDGQRIASASSDKTVRVWRADGTGPVIVLRGHDDYVNAVAFSPDGKRLASGSGDKTVRIWNADGSGQPLVLKGHGVSVYWVAFSPDGRHIASASADKTVRIWNADGTGQPIVLAGHEAVVYAVAFSPDGQRVVTGSSDGTARVWNADGSGTPIVLHDDAAVYGAAISPDGRRVATASGETVHVWNIGDTGDTGGTGKPLVLRGHEAGVRWVGFRSDGQRIVSSSRDGTVRVWNADGTGEPLVLRVSSKAANFATFSPDGRRIAATSDDKTVVVWSDLEPLAGADDSKLWAATTYCLPVAVRIRLLGFTEAQARADLERCARHVTR